MSFLMPAGLAFLGLLAVGGWLIFVRPWSSMAREEERMRRGRGQGE